MKTKNPHLFLAIFILALCVLLFLQRLTGGILHAVLGLLLTAVMIAHLCKNCARLRHKPFAVQAVDWALVALLAVLFLSGMLLHPLHGVLALKLIHKLAAVLFVLGLVVHALQHKKALLRGL